jgi:hypothetical protein
LFRQKTTQEATGKSLFAALRRNLRDRKTRRRVSVAHVHVPPAATAYPAAAAATTRHRGRRAKHVLRVVWIAIARFRGDSRLINIFWNGNVYPGATRNEESKDKSRQDSAQHDFILSMETL